MYITNNSFFSQHALFLQFNVCFYHQEKEGCHSSLYTLKWFMQCFLDRVCSIAAVLFPCSLNLFGGHVVLSEIEFYQN